MKIPAEEQTVATPRKAPESIEISVPVAAECLAVAEKLGIPYRSVRDVVAAHAADVLNRKILGQAARIYAAHVQGILPMQNAPMILTEEQEAR